MDIEGLKKKIKKAQVMSPVIYIQSCLYLISICEQQKFCENF